MTRRSIAVVLPGVLMFAIAASSGASGGGTVTARGTGVAPPVVPGERGAAAPQKGRYKKQGDTCVWDANDGGPNQCTPLVKGRFKKGANDSCTWDPDDVGDDQCRPPKGRWKKGSENSCVWDANDGGPDQCNPRQAK